LDISEFLRLAFSFLFFFAWGTTWSFCIVNFLSLLFDFCFCFLSFLTGSSFDLGIVTALVGLLPLSPLFTLSDFASGNTSFCSFALFLFLLSLFLSS
jgi:hypothetical protein